ncbi:MAG: hybrid sensor histidine kinase/response regulator [Paludibacter sp.]|nr:hybrid sensor histidine kinase/response regulator [Paludibacter sp.]MDD4199413.1 hybrid sensor histidine kinase/response regulator [Paludibacter sp.]MDD4427425.1 hybrid sensor histidine kinase/response regulator [Paludibacter sp.]
MNIERKIGFKAAVLYLLTGLIVVALSVYIYHQRNQIRLQRENVEMQQEIFRLTNELIQAVGETQLLGSRYIVSNDTRYIEQLDIRILQIDSLINLLTAKNDMQQTELQLIVDLMNKQAANIYTLNRRFAEMNPLTDISKRLQEYKPPVKEDINVVTIRHDTIIKKTEKKNFFRRLKDVFSPDIDSTIIVTNQRVDTLKVANTESPSILSDVDTIARKAGRKYEEHIRDIEEQVSTLISADRKISAEITTLLMRLHEETLVSVLDAINQSEETINRNYGISIIGGGTALGLILLFILLIINDVNKGKQAREKLRQVMESRHQLLLSVSHDIKSPLSSILAYLELKTGESEDIRNMQQAAKHILAMLENLLEYSSLEQGTLQLTMSDVEISLLEKETVDIFKPLAAAKGLQLQHEADEKRIRTDAMKIKQIIINLISNAIKYTPEGEVNVKLGYDDSKLIILVKDTGAGIPADKLDAIFKPFTRVESNNALAHGSGFGMYVVKGLVDMLGGTIHIESETGKGTQIKVIIPVETAENIISNRSRKIKLHEDDKITDELVRRMLKQLGHQIVEEDHDIILTDMEMGEISGLDILNNAGNVPVILMTGRGDFSAAKAVELGFAGFIAKPFTLDDLRSVFGESDNVKDENSFLAADDEEIMALFRNSTAENQALLQQALEAGDFNRAQSICHKMLPMFAQLGYDTEALRRMDAGRGKPYDGWQEDVKQIIAIRV